MTVPALIPELAEGGLTLQASLRLDDLEESTRVAMSDSGIDLSRFTSLVLLAQAGKTFWEQQVVENLHLEDPFDDRARAVVEEWFNSSHPDARWQAVYPGPAHLPLGQLASLAGWGEPSPLGLTINPEFGLWTAHRFALVTDLEFTEHQPEATGSSTHPCESCADTPCISACPVGAVSLTTGYDVEACAHHRIADDSGCALQCLARNACPVGADFQYGGDQMAHHYGAGLRSIREWLLGPEDNPKSGTTTD